MDEDEQALERAEDDVAEVVARVLKEVADEFAAGLDNAARIVAARFSVSDIGRMFRDRTPRIIRALLGVVETGAAATAVSVDAELPETWEDLPDRWEDGRRIPAPVVSYVSVTEHLLRAVGTRLAEAARRELAEGVAAGEDMEALRARLRERFSREASQLGEVREERVARTEAGRAWNTAVLGAAQALTGPERPLVKQWRTRGDERVRHDHDAVDGQLRLLDESFTVGGVSMATPHDPSAPAKQVVNCFPGDTLVQLPSGVRRIYRRWYEGPLIEVHTKDGGKLAGTPNHPLLTDAGWKPMQGVEVGDQLIGTPLGVRVGAGDPEVEHGPASLAELYRAAHEAGAPSRVVRGAVDFHGDVPDGDVEVVSLDGDLSADLDPPGLQGGDDAVLGLPGGGLSSLPGRGDRGSAEDLGGGAGVTRSGLSSGLVRGDGQRGALLEREALHTEPVGVAAGPDRHSGFGEAATDDRAAHAEGAGQGQFRLAADVPAHDLGVVDGGARLGALDARSRTGVGAAADSDPGFLQGTADAAPVELAEPGKVIDGLAGLVTLHEVVDVQIRAFSGHVYNLETGDGWYIANDIASSNCRCVLKVQAARRASAFDPSAPARTHAYDSTDGGGQTASADGSHLMGAMIALVPADANADALVLEGGEDVGELHLTLLFLGDDADDWDEDQRRELIQGLEARAAAMSGPVHANAFGVNHWNPASSSPCWVWAVGDDYEAPDGAPTLHEARSAAVDALEDMHNQPELPFQHSPWAPHVCAVYTAEDWPLEPMAERTGQLTFDRIRVAFGGEHTDIPLGPQEEPTMEDTTAAAVDTARLTRAWTTPGDAALAYEDTETGDGRLFAPEALYWEEGPWPLQYADEMGMGHDGAELAGAIDDMGRDSPRITGSGVVYTSRRAGQDVIQLLDEGAPLGVSVDLDDVDMQVIDRTANTADEDEGDFAVLASAQLASASVLRMADGAYCITASTGAEWTADGGGLSRQRRDFQVITNPGGTVPAALLRDLFGPAGPLTAAAGDSDSDDGMILWEESAGDLLIRFTRARVRGATLVAMPAYANARIVLEPLEGQEDEQQEEETAAAVPAGQTTSAEVREQLLAHVLSSPVAVSASEAATAVGIPMVSARSLLASAARDGDLVRIAHGQYVGATARVQEAVASAVDDGLEDLTASAWRAMQDLPPMPAEWFREPTAEELPPGSGGVHYKDGRVFGWVAQAGVPHVGYPGKSITIERLAREGIDYSKFLRANFRLDDGTTMPLGAMTMNVGHHRDGAQCETAACQFDNSGTVGAIVTIGMNGGGMWFSGAAAPWLSDWDRSVFLACQPSYHLKSRKGGGWELGAILDVPNPGHPSPLVAAVVERSNLALAASAAAADIASGEHPDGHPDVIPGLADGLTVTAAELGGHHPDPVSGEHPDTEYVFPNATEVATAVVAAMLTDGQFLDSLNDALEARVVARSEQRDEIDRLAAQMDPTTAELAAAAVGAPTGEETA